MLMENAVKHTKDVFITFLRLYFNNPKNYKNKLPTQISDEHFLEASFYDSEPEQLRKWPTVIISASTGNMITSGLGDMCSEIRDPRTGSIIAYRYQGIYEFAITIDIGCRNPLDREVFTDLIAKALRFGLRRFIQNQGVIIKDVSYGGESTIDYNSDKVYVSQLRINTWSTWIEDVDLLDPNEFNVNVDMNLKIEDEIIKNNPVVRDEKQFEKNGENN